ncbi:MAG: response regulator [Myxococcota bacterium]|nr:response regulator [Myxococcota bacterium]
MTGCENEKDRRMLTLFEAGRCCGVSTRTIAEWVESGKLGACCTDAGHRRIRPADLNEFLAQRQMPLVDEAVERRVAGEWPRRCILVVDDDLAIVETLVLALEEDEFNYEVISAADGFEAGLQVSRCKPHLVILDIMMPDTNGYQVCRRLKSDPETAEIKIVVLSAYMDDESYRRMREYGADLCFSKPLPLDQLRDEVARLLGLVRRSSVPGGTAAEAKSS